MEKYFNELRNEKDGCGSNCGCNHNHDHDNNHDCGCDHEHEEVQKINLELEDGKKVTCIVLATFEVFKYFIFFNIF